jgi:hypothetical protein
VDDQTQRVLDLLADHPEAYREYSAALGTDPADHDWSCPDPLAPISPERDVAAFARFVQGLLAGRPAAAGLDPARVDWRAVRETVQDADPQMAGFAAQLAALGVDRTEFDRMFAELRVEVAGDLLPGGEPRRST